MVAPILALPNELLLSIVDFLPHLPRNRRTELLALSKTCKRLHTFAFTVLLTTPYVKLTHTRSLVDNYIAHPDLALKACSLELYAEHDVAAPANRAPRPFFRHAQSAIRKNKQHWKAYTRLVRSTSLPANTQATWKLAIEHEDERAWIGMLLAVLPNLNCLLLGGVPMRYFEQLDALCGAGYKTRDCSCEFRLAPSPYLGDVFLATAQRLTMLELPFNIYQECWALEWPLARYTGLTHLIANLHMLEQKTHPFDADLPQHGVNRPLHGYFALPSTLRKLTISCDCESEIIEVLECIALRKTSGAMPDFIELEVYVVDDTAVKYGDHLPLDEYHNTEALGRKLQHFIAPLPHINVKAHYSDECCYFDRLLELLMETNVMGYIPSTAKTSASARHYHLSLFTYLRMLELRGTFGGFEEEIKGRELLHRAERVEEWKAGNREREQKHKGKRDDGEVSDTDSEDIGFATWDWS